MEENINKMFLDQKDFQKLDENLIKYFENFNEYMMKEQNAEISENIPMYLDLNN